VLLPLVVSLAFAVAGLLVVAKATQLALRRLGLELFTVLEWLGLAETPLDELTARRARPLPPSGPQPKPNPKKWGLSPMRK
jgi:hypothetical protein